MFGSASIISAETAPDTLVRSVCSSGDSAETSTVWSSVPTDNSTGTRTVSVALRMMPDRLNGAKPERVTVMEYVPAGSRGAVKRPASLVTSSCDAFVPSLATTTEAPGTIAFWESVTVPVSVADRIWAWATDVHAKQSRIRISRDSCFNTSASLATGFPWRRGGASHRCAS